MSVCVCVLMLPGGPDALSAACRTLWWVRPFASSWRLPLTGSCSGLQVKQGHTVFFIFSWTPFASLPQLHHLSSLNKREARTKGHRPSLETTSSSLIFFSSLLSSSMPSSDAFSPVPSIRSWSTWGHCGWLTDEIEPPRFQIDSSHIYWEIKSLWGVKSILVYFKQARPVKSG